MSDDWRESYALVDGGIRGCSVRSAKRNYRKIGCTALGAVLTQKRPKEDIPAADGLYEKRLILNGKRIVLRAKTEKEIMQKIAAYTGEMV